MTRILIVEDDDAIARNLTDFLCGEGFDAFAVPTAAQALETVSRGPSPAFRVIDFANRAPADLAILDVNLPDGSGFALCSAIKEKLDIPVIFLTASGDEFSVVTGLELGADDYIAKPFRPRELVSRIRTVLRRAGKASSVFELEGLRVDTERAQVTKNGREVFLSALEYRLLLVFLSNRGAVLSRSRLLEEIWDVGGDFVNDNTLTVYIKRLRDKIEDDPADPKLIKTVRGLGYRL